MDMRFPSSIGLLHEAHSLNIKKQEFDEEIMKNPSVHYSLRNMF